MSLQSMSSLFVVRPIQALEVVLASFLPAEGVELEEKGTTEEVEGLGTD
jgi:hypothetical protein